MIDKFKGFNRKVQPNSPFRAVVVRREGAMARIEARLSLSDEELMKLPRGKRFKDDEPKKYRKYLNEQWQILKDKAVR